MPEMPEVETVKRTLTPLVKQLLKLLFGIQRL